MTRRRGREAGEGPLADHVRKGRLYRPPLMALDMTTLLDWVRDDLPDLIWPLMLAEQGGDEAIQRFEQLQRLTIATLGQQVFEDTPAAMDGRLTSLEAFDPQQRAQLLANDHWRNAVSTVRLAGITATLRLYDDAPGAWLLVDEADSPAMSNDEAVRVLVTAIVEGIRGGNREALAKLPRLTWLALRRKVSMPSREAAAMRDYWTNTSERGLADSLIRTHFMLDRTTDDETRARQLAWASSFWAQNWAKTECLPEEETKDEDDAVNDGSDEDDQDRDDEGGLASAVQEALTDTASMARGFLGRALDHNYPLNLHNPARHEVVCGLASRAIRIVYATLRDPHLWNGEYGMSTIRALAETEILLGWMRQQDPSIYETYQRYGRGKEKLMKAHLETLIKTTPTRDPNAEPLSMAESAVSHIDKKLGGEWGAGFVDVNVDATFSGLSVRRMALDAGLEDTYRHVYQPTSGVTHGEWWAIEDYTMQRCMNPLHRFHQIPSFAPHFPIADRFGQQLVAALEQVLLSAFESLGIDPYDDEGDAEPEPDTVD